MMLKGKKGLILGVANNKSIAWGIAEQLMKQGAEVAFSYQSERLRLGLDKLLVDYPSSKKYCCDVGNQEEIDQLSKNVEKDFDKLDFVVHSLAFADKHDLENKFINTSRDSFLKSVDISCYSLVAVMQSLQDLLNDNASVIALTYLGAVNTVLNYNVMGVSKAALESTVRYLAIDLGEKNVRVNAISAGPIQTLAARGIRNFSVLHKIHPKISPLKKSVTIEDVGNVAVFLCSPMSQAISSEIIYVDGGFHNVAVGPMEVYNY